MAILTFFLISIFLSLGQTSLFPLNFLLVLVVWEGLTERDFLFKSFLSGLIFDLISGLRLGISSVAFLLISFLSYLYARKFSKFHFVFLLGILALAILIFNFLVKERFFTSVDGLLVLFFVGFAFFKKFSSSKDFEIKLKFNP